MPTIETAKRPYESLLILPPETTQEAVDALLEKIKTLLSQEDGAIRGVQNWGRRRLAYPIKKYKEGLYVYFDFNGAPSAARAIRSFFHVTDTIVRHLTVLRDDFEGAKTEQTDIVGEKPASPAIENLKSGTSDYLESPSH